MGAISIVKGFVLDSFHEAKNRFENFKLIYLGLLAVNVVVRIPSAHLGYDSSNIFYSSSISVFLHILISILTANLIITKIALDSGAPKEDLVRASLRYLKGQILYYIAAAIGFLLLVIPALLALFFFCLSPTLEVLERHKGVSSLKQSYTLIKKDVPVVFILFFVVFILHVILEIVFSRLRTTIPGVTIYFFSALLITFVSVVIALTYLRLINYLKDLLAPGVSGQDEIS